MTWYNKDYLNTYLNSPGALRRDKIIADALYSQTSLATISKKYDTPLSRVQKLVQQHFYAEVAQSQSDNHHFQTTLERNHKTYLEADRPDLAACYRLAISSFLPRKGGIRI